MAGPGFVSQSITVYNKSNKAVSTSKHLVNIFKEAKTAYRERKAEINANKAHRIEAPSPSQRSPRPHSRAYSSDEDRTLVARNASHHRRSSDRNAANRHSIHRKPVPERSRSTRHGASSSRHHARVDDDDLQSVTSSRTARTAMTRRHTTLDAHPAHTTEPMYPPHSAPLLRSHSTPGPLDLDLAYGGPPPPPDSPRRHSIDMSLAYGDLPPPELPLRRRRTGEEGELSTLVLKARMILEEADCLQYSVTAIIANLQKNPEAMAAVALTLAEISNLAGKMAPSAMVAIRAASPAVFALLASPQFLVAVGVGVGVTVVALGGYKIIKRIRRKKAEEGGGEDEMLELDPELERIERWRRGIAVGGDVDDDDRSIGTSVEGEFITPNAAALSRLDLNGEGEGRRARSLRHPSGRSAKEGKEEKKKAEKGRREREKKERKEREKKEKKPSGLRLLLSH